MKKASGHLDDDLRPEYSREDFGPGRRGVMFDAAQAGSNLVLLSPDVAAAFPTPEAVDAALRGLMRLANRSVAKPKGKVGSATEQGRTVVGR